MRECLTEEILQAFFDGELPAVELEEVASHLVGCATCAMAVREVEAENSLLRTTLGVEFELPVPTERLRQRIDHAVAGLSFAEARADEEPAPGWFSTLFASAAGLFSFSPQRTFAYAGLALVLAFGAVLTVIKFQQSPKDNSIAAVAPVPTDNGSALNPAVLPSAATTSTPVETGTTVSKPTTPNRPKVRPQRNSATANQQLANHVKLLPGERSYLKTIAALDTTIKGQGNRPMRPLLQAEYERNLALVDRALAVARSAAKSNPDDPDAAEFMFAAYQNKVDFLNTVADARVYNRQR